MFNLDDLHGIAIGNLTSQVFANFFLGLFDNYIIKTLGYKYYGRYVDDFYIIHPDKKQLLKDYKLLCNFAKQALDMKINTNKFYLQHYTKGVKFIGYFVYYDRMYIRNTTVHKFYELVQDLRLILLGRYDDDYLLAYYYHDSPCISTTLAERIIPSWNSYVGMLVHVKGYNILKRIKKKYPEVINLLLTACDMDENGFIRIKKS